MTKKNLITLTLIFTIILIISGISLFLFLNKKESNQKMNKNNNKQEIKKEETIINGIDIANWKTYRNEEYGYMIKYPNDWNIRELKIGASFKKGGGEILVESWPIFGHFANLPLKEYIENTGSGIQDYDSIHSIKEVKTNTGIIGYEVIWNIDPDSFVKKDFSDPIIYFEVKKQDVLKDAKTIQISYRSTPNDYSKKIFNTMIKTFDYLK